MVEPSNIMKHCVKVFRGPMEATQVTPRPYPVAKLGTSGALHGKLGISITHTILNHVTRATHHWKACDERIPVVPRLGSNNEAERKL